MFVKLKSWTSLKIGHVGSKPRSLGQILKKKKKKCVHSSGHILVPILIKLCQNVCLDENLDESENGSCWIKVCHKVKL